MASVWMGQERERAILDRIRRAVQDLTPLEESLLETAARDEIFSGAAESLSLIRGEVVSWLLTTADAVELLPRRRLRMRDVTVSGTIDLIQARTSMALVLERATVLGRIDLEGARLAQVLITDSRIGGEQPASIDATTCFLEGDFIFLRSSARDLRLRNAAIGGQLSCIGSTFSNRGASALSADGARIAGSVLLGGNARFDGAVRLYSATIGGQLSCIGSTFSHPTGDALGADGARINGNVALHDEARFEGCVRLIGARIGGALSCIGSSFSTPGGYALRADEARVTGSVFLHGRALFEGEVGLRGATIGGTLSCIGSTFKNPDGDAVNVQDAEVNGEAYFGPEILTGNLVLRHGSFMGGLWVNTGGIDHASEIDLSDGIIGAFHIGHRSSSTMRLRGATYSRIEAIPPGTLPAIVGTLLEQWRDDPYVAAETHEHLASALRGAGQDALAQTVMIAWHDRRLNDPRTDVWSRLSLGLFRRTMLYGYAPFRPLAVATCIAAIGTATMLVATFSDVITPPFGAWRILGSLVTGVGALIPLNPLYLEPQRTNLAHANAVRDTLYNLAWGWYWFESVAGWLLGAIIIAGLANVIRRV
jgi:hypothetical protein